MQVTYYKTDLGIVVKDNISIRLKSSYEYKAPILSEEQFKNSNPVKLKKGKYLEELNNWFRNSEHKWEYKGKKYMKLPNFEIDSKGKITNYEETDLKYWKSDDYRKEGYCVLHHQKVIYFRFYPNSNSVGHGCYYDNNGDYKWTNIKNCSPIKCITDKRIL